MAEQCVEEQSVDSHPVSPITIEYDDIFGCEENQATESVSATTNQIHQSSNFEQSHLNTPISTTESIVNSNSVSKPIVKIISAAQQRYCCVKGCNNYRGKRLRHNLKYYQDSDFKPDYLQMKWEKICPDCYRNRENTPHIALAKSHTNNTNTTPTTTSLPTTSNRKSTEPTKAKYNDKRKHNQTEEIESEIEEDASESDDNDNTKPFADTKKIKLVSDPNQKDCCILGCTNLVGRHVRSQLPKSESIVLYKPNYLKQNYNMLCNACYMKYFVAGITTRRKSRK